MKAGPFLRILPPLIFAISPPASAAEISFDFNQTGVHIQANPLQKLESFAGRASNHYYQILDENAVSSSLQPREEEAASTSKEPEQAIISQGPILVRPSKASLPPNALLFSALRLNMKTGILRLSMSDGKVSGFDDASPLTEIRKDDTYYSFFIKAPYASDYIMNAGQFSWPVSLDIIAIDGSKKLIETSGASALVRLDSLEGQFTLTGQVQTLTGEQASLHLASQLTSDNAARPKAIAPILSLSVHGTEYRSLARLSIILPGNEQSDIAGQFNNFRDDYRAEDSPTIAGQFNSASEIDK